VLGSAADFSEVRRAISSMTGVELATLGLTHPVALMLRREAFVRRAGDAPPG